VTGQRVQRSVVMAKRAQTDHPILDILAARWSPYVFSSRPVSREDLQSLFEAARWAPSSYNEQPWSYIVATREEPAEFERLLSCLVGTNQEWARVVPVLALGVVTSVFKRNGKPNPAAEHDLGLAAGNLLAEATARGLSVHQMIGILPDRARELYAIPEGSRALTGIAIGYAGELTSAPEKLRDRDLLERTRKPLPEMVFGGRFGSAAPWLKPT
jgi:nitroreductase